MIIYKLSINKILDPTSSLISSGHIDARRKQSEEYYLTEELAKARQKEIYDGLSKLIGFIPNMETNIEKIEVKEN